MNPVNEEGVELKHIPTLFKVRTFPRQLKCGHPLTRILDSLSSFSLEGPARRDWRIRAFSATSLNCDPGLLCHITQLCETALNTLRPQRDSERETVLLMKREAGID
jgi:hypothetical protein